MPAYQTLTPVQPILALCLDVFGTLVQITNHTRPYHAIIRRLPQDRQAGAAHTVMSHHWGLRDAADRLGVDYSETEMAKWERDLAVEIASIECFPETLDVLRELRKKGYAMALCSNLAKPYAAPVEALVGKYFDVKVWSFDSGCVKPNPRIYAKVARELDLPPHRILMSGDTEEADYLAPQKAGLRAMHLARKASEGSRQAHQIADLRALLNLG